MILSIVVPVYGVAQYLPKCVDSLLHQDLREEEYEIILVDDGSPDNCGAICDEYASKHSNVRVIHRKNGGLSAARNSGIDAANGKYVQFVDSDDYLEPNVLKALVNKMEADRLDILRFNYQNVNEKGKVFSPNKVDKPFMDYRDEVCDGLRFLNERLGFACYAVQFMLKTEMLKPSENRFVEGIYFEDTEWTPRILVQAKRVTSVDMVVYNYLMRVGSITQSVETAKKKKSLDDRMLLIDALQRQMQTLTDDRWHRGMIAQTVITVVSYISNNFYGERRKYLSKLKAKHVHPLSSYHALPTAKRKIALANVSLGLLCFLLKKRK